MVDIPIHRDVTRANKFQKKFALPGNFAVVLKDFTREVLRDQPPDILAYGANYFKKLALQQDEEAEVHSPSVNSRKQYSYEERERIRRLESQLVDAMAEEDFDKTHKLHSHIIKRVLKSSCNLSADHCLFLISNAGENIDLQNGTIDYEKFVTENIHITHFFMTSNHPFKNIRHKNEDTVHGLTQDDLMARLMNLLQAADASGTGRLTLEQYHQCLRQAELQLTQRDITLLTAEAMVSEQNVVQYADEVVRSFGLLVYAEMFEKFAQDWKEGRV